MKHISASGTGIWTAFVVLLLATQVVHGQDGFILYNATFLDDALGSDCINALTAPISCDLYVQTFTQPDYRGSLGDKTATDKVCSATCSGSLQGYFNDVTTKCGSKTLDYALPNRLGGYLWYGFNETCVKDPKTKNYCNDIIANFTVVANYKLMPQAELCSTCHVRRISMMQASPYSFYNAYYKGLLTYMYSACNLTGATDIPPSIVALPADPAPYCVSGKRYTTLQNDTCEAIANAMGAASAALYMGNQALLPDCMRITAGISVCVPLTCNTYYLAANDTCASIEHAVGLDFGQVRNFNQWLSYDCSNLQTAAASASRRRAAPTPARRRRPPRPRRDCPTATRARWWRRRLGCRCRAARRSIAASGMSWRSGTRVAVSACRRSLRPRSCVSSTRLSRLARALHRCRRGRRSVSAPTTPGTRP
jgi:hypothetical protein